MQQPAWLDHAWADFGQREVAGAGDNPHVLQYYKDVGFTDVHHDEVAWCAAFVGACLERAGMRSTRLLLARSYLPHGTPLETGRLGAIAVLSRGSDPALGHVGFWLGETASRIHLLGGNQGDAVSVEGFDKTRLLGLRWPGEVPALQQTGAGEADLFAFALAHVLEMEGGWSEDPYDPGGPTNQGITLATYADWRAERLDAASLAALEAELRAIGPDTVRQIYLRRYWGPCRAEALPPALALMHFDAAVNHGVGGAARMLQQALDVAVDGEIGPQTLAAAGARGPAEVVGAYADIRRRRYRALDTFWRFGRGWLARVDKTATKALAMRSASPSTDHATEKGARHMSTTQETDSVPTKWWGESLTIWGVMITTLATVLPVVGPLIGLDISAEMIRQIGAQATSVLQAIGGLMGTLMAVYGRFRATAPLVQREMRLKL